MDRAHYREWIGNGVVLADRALALDSANASAQELRATLVYWKVLLNLADGDEDANTLVHEAEAGFRRAIAASDAAASAYNSLSHLLLNKGEPAEAKLNALHAYQQDPFLENANLTLWRIFQSSWVLQDAVEANRYCKEGGRRFAEDFRFQQCELMLMALPGQQPDIARAWQLLERFAELSPPQVRDVNRQRGRTYVAMALARAGMPDSVRAVLRQTRASSEIDPLREIPWLASVALTWIGDTEEAVRRLSLYLAANPEELANYKEQASQGELPWYHQALVDDPRFRAFAGLR
jgi:tetratricopeptide (TPR) repeat protein